MGWTRSRISRHRTPHCQGPFPGRTVFSSSARLTSFMRCSASFFPAGSANRSGCHCLASLRSAAFSSASLSSPHPPAEASNADQLSEAGNRLCFGPARSTDSIFELAIPSVPQKPSPMSLPWSQFIIRYFSGQMSPAIFCYFSRRPFAWFF
jgi:hypothetical protein